VSQVKPSPIGLNSTWSGKASNTTFSPVCSAPFTNWMTATFWPWPMARQTMPRAAVVLPLPAPVLTISRPFSICRSAIILARAVWTLAILALWRALRSASSTGSLIGSPQRSVAISRRRATGQSKAGAAVLQPGMNTGALKGGAARVRGVAARS